MKRRLAVKGWLRPLAFAGMAALVLPGVLPMAARAQDKPLSAIDWLSDSVATPVALPLPTVTPGGDVATSALPEDVSVMPLGGPVADSVGLLAASQTGLSPDLWGRSSSRDIAGRLQALESDLLPAARDLVQMLILAELDPPYDSSPEAILFLARIDALLARGALEPAQNLILRAGPDHPQVFRRWFDISLLLGTEDRACAKLRDTPELSPTFPARIFCLARGGDWDAAALTLETAEALGMLTPEDDALLAQFLHPELAEGGLRLEAPNNPNPLVFRMYEAIGAPLATGALPLAFAQSDLRANIGWKAQLDAAERLARAGAISPQQLHDIYLEGKPAASGGVWDRVKAYQTLDMALERQDISAVSAALAPAWQAMEGRELEVPFAALYGARLAELPLTGRVKQLANRIALLSPDYEVLARKHSPATEAERFWFAISQGDLRGVSAPDAYSEAVREGFAEIEFPTRLQSLTQNDRMGEAILRAISLLSSGAQGDLDEISDAFAFLRNAGLEDTARRAALQLLLLERRG
ncbi:MAG: hypothetical protein ACRBBK_00955 [Paracoccaceae bacterium]